MQKQPQEVFCEKRCFKKFHKIRLRPATLLKRVSGTGVFLWILQNFSKQLFYRTPLGDCFCKYEFQNNISKFKISKKAWEALKVYFSNKLRVEQKLHYCRQDWSTGKPKWGISSWHSNCWLEIFHILIEKRKATRFASLCE